MEIVLVCIAKDEDNYIAEWLDYNFKLGFNKIFIYANDWNYKNNDSRVSVINFNGRRKQAAAYNDFKRNRSKGYDWVAFFDVDEFLVLHKHCCIHNFLQSYNSCKAIGINWAVFGNNGHTKIIDNNYNVIDRFTKRSTEDYGENTHIKSIVKLPDVGYQGVHCLYNTWHNLKGQARQGHWNKPVDWSIAQLNHYYTKSEEELRIKCDRGRADSLRKKKFERIMKNLSKMNQIEDLKAKEFYYRAKKCEHF